MRLSTIWRSERVREWGSLGVLLLVAFALRLIFFTGMVRGDALNYAHAAYALSEGDLNFNAWVGASRIGLFFPVAGLYALFGPSEIATVFFPLFCSLLTIVFVYLIARMYGGRPAGLVAALLWCFLALDVHLATSLIPDGPLAAFSTGAVYFLFLAERERGSQKKCFLVVGLFLLLWAILIKPLAIITLIFFGVYGLIQIWPPFLNFLKKFKLKQKTRQRWAPIILLILAFISIVYSMRQSRSILTTLLHANNDLAGFLFTGATQLDFGPTDFSNSDLFIYIAPMFLVSTLLLFRENKKGLKPLFLWAAVLFIYYEWGTVNLNPLTYTPIMPFQEARLFLFLLAPFVILAGIYLSRYLTGNAAAWAIPVVGLSALFIGWLSKPTFDQAEWAPWTSLSSGFAVVGALLSPLANRTMAHQGAKIGLAIAYLFALCLAMLQPFLPYHALMFEDRAKIVEQLRTTVPFLRENSEMPVLVQEKLDAMWLNYISGFEFGYEWQAQHVEPSRIKVDSPGPNDSAYAIITDPASKIPSNWWHEVSFFGDWKASQGVFRVLTPEDAAVELRVARTAFDQDQSLNNLEQLHGAAINALSWPDVFSTWIDLHDQLPDKYPFDKFSKQIIDHINGLPTPDAVNLFNNADFSDDLSAWDGTALAEVITDSQPDNSTLRLDIDSEADRIGQEILLQPSELYIFRMTIRTSSEFPVDPLEVDGGQIADSFPVSEIFGESTEIIIVFLTPDWSGPQATRINLFVPNGMGQIWIQSPSLSPLLAEFTN